MPTIWRLNIKTAAVENIDPRMFCINRGILGVGWQVDTEETLDWESYYKLGEEEYYNNGYKGWWPAVNALHNRMEINDLCWTRDENGIYYIGRITSDWEYCATQEHKKADVVNIRNCDWFKVGTVDSVPGKVVNSFIPSRTVQTVNDDSVGIYSQFVYNELSTNKAYQLSIESADIFSLISSEDCEDIVGLYLQENGYRIIPSSCKSDTAAYEFVLKHTQSNQNAVVQVKQGSVVLNIDNYKNYQGEVFLFTTHGSYNGSPVNNVKCLKTGDMLRFVLSNRSIMSDRINTWIDISERICN